MKKSTTVAALAFAVACAIASIPTFAGTIIAYTDPGPASGYVDPDWNFALGFTANSAITVTSLGVFDNSGNGIINGPVEVAIFPKESLKNSPSERDCG